MNKSRNVNQKKFTKRNNRNIRNQKEPKDNMDSKSMQETKHSYNDVRWYVPNEEMLKAAASISFENATGDSIYSEFNAIKRAYGVLRHFEYKNKYTPEALLRAMGLDYESWKNNMSDIWFSLNYWSNQISKYAVPQIMSIFIRHSWLSTNVYKDGSNDKNQMYLFNPSVVYQLEDNPTNGLQLTGINSGFGIHNNWATPKPVHSTWAVVKSIMNDMIEKVSQEQDFEIISSYILKQYSNNLFTLGSTPADYEISAVYDESVLLQIHNATNLLPASSGTFDITQVVDKDAGISYLASDPKNELPLLDNYDLYIDLMDKEADPAVIMEATRLMATGIGGASQGTYSSFGGDVVYRTGMVYYDGAPGVGASLMVAQDYGSYQNVDRFKTDAARIKQLALRSKFNYAPAIMVMNQSAPEKAGLS